MSETLAIDGGVPVRDTEASPWPTWPDNTEREWEEEIVPILKEVYLGQTEGLPAPVGHRFGQAFAAYCDAAYGVMMPSGTTSIAAGLSAALDLDGLVDSGEVIIPTTPLLPQQARPSRCGALLPWSILIR